MSRTTRLSSTALTAGEEHNVECKNNKATGRSRNEIIQVRLFTIIVTVNGRLLILHSSIDLDHTEKHKQNTLTNLQKQLTTLQKANLLTVTG